MNNNDRIRLQLEHIRAVSAMLPDLYTHRQIDDARFGIEQAIAAIIENLGEDGHHPTPRADSLEWLVRRLHDDLDIRLRRFIQQRNYGSALSLINCMCDAIEKHWSGVIFPEK